MPNGRHIATPHLLLNRASLIYLLPIYSLKFFCFSMTCIRILIHVHSVIPKMPFINATEGTIVASLLHSSPWALTTIYQSVWRCLSSQCTIFSTIIVRSALTHNALEWPVRLHLPGVNPYIIAGTDNIVKLFRLSGTSDSRTSLPAIYLECLSPLQNPSSKTRVDLLLLQPRIEHRNEEQNMLS